VSGLTTFRGVRGIRLGRRFQRFQSRASDTAAVRAQQRRQDHLDTGQCPHQVSSFTRRGARYETPCPRSLLKPEPSDMFVIGPSTSCGTRRHRGPAASARGSPPTVNIRPAPDTVLPAPMGDRARVAAARRFFYGRNTASSPSSSTAPWLRHAVQQVGGPAVGKEAGCIGALASLPSPQYERSILLVSGRARAFSETA